VRTAIIALSAAALIAASGVAAQAASSKSPRVQHDASRKLHPVVSDDTPWRVMHARGAKTGYPAASGYAPSAPKDYTSENSRNAGGGGGGGSGM
jgi:hypothetical protein